MKDVILAVIAILGPVIAAFGGLRFHRQNKQKLELDNQRAGVGIEIDEATHNKLVQDAATINQEREQKREEWWGSQIQMLRDEIEAERKLSNVRFRRLNELENWATLHVIWDRRAYAYIHDQVPDFEPPPELPQSK